MSWFRVSRRDSLDRYYLFKFLGFGVFLHRIKQSDPDTAFHTHPWDGVSLIFGSYTEHRFGKRSALRRFLNFVRATTPHRVELSRGPVWTIFFHGRRYNRWGVFDADGCMIEAEPWRGIGGRGSYLREGSNDAGSD